MRQGTIRLEVTSELRSWHQRYGLRDQDGQTVEEVEPLGFDLTRETVGPSMVPTLAAFQELVSNALGSSSFALDLGNSTTTWNQSITRVPIRVDVGVTDWLTLSGTIPLVRTEPEVDLAFRADSASANVGVNPATTDPGTVGTFLSNLGTDVTTFEATAGTICQDQGAEAPDCLAALTLLEEGQDIQASLTALYEDPAAFVPLRGTDAGRGLDARVTDFQTSVEELGQPTTAGPPPLSDQGLDAGTFNDLVGDPAYGVQMGPLAPLPGAWGLGDVELAVAARLLDRMTRPEHQERSFRYQLGAEARLRFGTGAPPDPDFFQDPGTGDGQSDVEVRAFGSVLLGRRWGLWGHARVVWQGSTSVTRRVTRPDVLLVPVSSTTTVQWTPGNTLDVYLAPRYRFTDGLSLLVPYRAFTKGTDRYTLEDGSSGVPPGAPESTPPVSTLDQETEMTGHSLGLGIVYSTLPAFRRGRSSWPIELRALYQGTIGGSGGQTPKGSVFSVSLRLYLSFWGDGA